jgi:hypothetical protein
MITQLRRQARFPVGSHAREVRDGREADQGLFPVLLPKRTIVDPPNSQSNR